MKKFDYRKFSSGYYNLITRGGHKAKFIPVEDHTYIAADVPDAVDCRGNFRYGYDKTGNRTPVGEDQLDLFMVHKGFWQTIAIFFLKLFGKYSV